MAVTSAASRVPGNSVDHVGSLRRPPELVGQGDEALEEQLLLRVREQQPLVRERVSLQRPDEGSFRC